MTNFVSVTFFEMKFKSNSVLKFQKISKISKKFDQNFSKKNSENFEEMAYDRNFSK